MGIEIFPNWSLEVIKLKFGTLVDHGMCYTMDDELPPMGHCHGHGLSILGPHL